MKEAEFLEDMGEWTNWNRVADFLNKRGADPQW